MFAVLKRGLPLIALYRPNVTLDRLRAVFLLGRPNIWYRAIIKFENRSNKHVLQAELLN